MAEQAGHNVVNGPESAGAPALADVAENQTYIASAFDGKQSSSPAPALPVDTNQTASLNALADHAAVPRSQVARLPSANPSAGDAGMKQSDSSEVAASVLSHKAGLLSADGIAEDGRTTPVSVDHSVHSDTDTSRADAAEHGKDGLHSRTNSVKKPATFSKVSVTKTFLAKSVTPVQATARPGERATPVGTPTALVAKPRLVAKTGSALQGAQKAGAAGGSSTGPDASKVWNRNRPVAPPPPSKTLTDEQLKQQYGIHLATRLQTDDNGKEKNWADIDDDDDDWAPEAVVWMDGTKSTLAPTPDTVAVPAELQKQLAPAAPAGDTSLPKPTTESAKPAAPKIVRPTGPPKTILKPGSAQLAKQQGPSSSTPANGAAGLKVKSPAPTPTKSPWAPLPPVESVSPIHPPSQQGPAAPQAVLPTQDARAYEPMQPQPTREIAADSFDRSWHEGEGGSRELFNSANGRYEPAAETRRGSMRTDRKPALLQRAGGMPAEPSAAFQSRSNTQMDGPWARRRGSSISQGSLPPGRRVSMSRGSELAPPSERQSSTASGQDARNQPQDAKADVARPTFTQPSPWDAQMPPQPEEASAPAEDPVKVQERIMREKRELAIKRRKEEEERQEAEKQERIKARLAALEGAGKSRKERQAEAAASTAPVPSIKEETSLKPPSGKEAAPSTESGNVESGSTVLQEVSATAAPKPHGETLQDRTAVAVTEAAPHPAQRSHLSPNATAPLSQQQRQLQSSYSSPGDRKSQPFERSPLTNSGSISPWGPTPSNGNVWGSSGIGNGTFEKASSFAPRPLQGSNLPPPPGMPNIMRQGPQRLSPQTQGQEAPSALQQPQVSEPLRNLGTLGIDSPAEKNWVGRSGAVPTAPGLSRHTHAPGPIAPPSRAHQQNVQQGEGISAWNRAAQAMQFESVPNEARNDSAPAALGGVAGGTVKATFKQTGRATTLGSPRRIEQTEYSIIDGSGSRAVSSHNPMPPNAQTQPAGPFTTAPAFEDSPNFIGNTVRIPDGSRNPAHGASPTQQPPIAPPSVQTRAMTASPGNVHFRAGPLAPGPPPVDHAPPPPEESSASKISQPKVRLPPPPPVVKLPPALVAGHAGGQRHSSQYLPNGQHRPITQNPDWQARFNGLFGRAPIHTEVPPSPPGTPPKTFGASLAVASSSKTLFDQSLMAATVSLPRSSGEFTLDDSADVLSKVSIEPIFYEELSFGSLPRINIPRHVAYPVDFLDRSKVSLLNRDSQLKKSYPADIQSKIPAEEYRPILFYKEVGAYFLRIPRTRLENKPVHYETTGERRGNHSQGSRKPSGKYPRTRGREGDAEGQSKSVPARPSSGRKATAPSNAAGEANPRKKSSHFKKPRGGAQTATSTS